MLFNGISAWVITNRTVLSHLCGWIGERDSNSRCRECPIWGVNISKALGLDYSSTHARNNYVGSASESLHEGRIINVLRPCIKYFTLQGREESEKMWQFPKGRGLKITRDVAHIILIFHYAYKI